MNIRDQMPPLDTVYPINPGRLINNPTITIVGCGGTGGFAAEAICRLFTGRRMNLILIDPDTVEPRNLLRQNFYKEDIGRPKAQALAERLSRVFDIPIGYSIRAFGQDDGKWQQTNGKTDLLIGCVDRASARQKMESSAKSITGPIWYIDAGNGDTWGQVLIGNINDADSVAQCLSYQFTDGEKEFLYWERLPSPATQQPSLLIPEPPEQPPIDCAAALDLTGQDPAINRLMADIIMMTVRKLVQGSCRSIGIYLNMETGIMHPVRATPRNVAFAFRMEEIK